MTKIPIGVKVDIEDSIRDYFSYEQLKFKIDTGISDDHSTATVNRAFKQKGFADFSTKPNMK